MSDALEPIPREEPLSCFEDWMGELPLELLEAPPPQEKIDIFSSIEKRHSSRAFHPLPVGILSSFLWFTAKTVEVRERQPFPAWERRRLPSAGGCHVVHLLVASRSHMLGVYDARAHGFRKVVDEPLRGLFETLPEEFRDAEGTVILFFGDPGRINGFYKNWSSLAWRDAGVIIGGMSLVAAALQCSFCPIGIVGTTQAQLVTGRSSVIGLGACMVGKQVS